MPRSRSYVFTLNNPTPEEMIDALPACCEYFCFQLEEGEQGTPHYQGVFQLKNAKSLNGVKGSIPQLIRSHLEVRRGSWQEAIDYCKKEEGRLDGPWEYGVAPKQGKRKDLDIVKEKLDADVPMKVIADEHFGTYIRYNKGFAAYKRLKMQGREAGDPMTVCLVTGAPGLGKTWYVNHVLQPAALRHGLKGVYVKSDKDKWWPDYEGEEIIIINEINGSWFGWDQLLNLWDSEVGGITVQNKGGHMPFNGKMWLLTSNVEPETWYNTKQAHVDNWAALERRITHRVAFLEPRVPTWTKGEDLSLLPPPIQEEEVLAPGTPPRSPRLQRQDAGIEELLQAREEIEDSQEDSASTLPVDDIDEYASSFEMEDSIED